jgi:hypothetical protein
MFASLWQASTSPHHALSQVAGADEPNPAAKASFNIHTGRMPRRPTDLRKIAAV